METERIRFSHWNEAGLEFAEKLWGDPEVTQLIGASGRFTEQEIRDRYALELANEEQYGLQYWPIFDRVSGDLIGCCGLRPAEGGAVELGFHLRPEFWGQGYAKEAAEAVIRYAFGKLGKTRILVGHNPKNTRSARVIEKLGFRYLGAVYYPPTGLDHPSYELVRGAQTP